MLRLSLIGNLGVDPEVGVTQKGTPIATLRVAVNHQRTDTTTGERREQTEWFRVRAMGRLVEPSQRPSKGGRVLVMTDLTSVITRRERVSHVSASMCGLMTSSRSAQPANRWLYARRTTLVDLLHRRRRAALCRLAAHCRPRTQQPARTTPTTIRICRGEAIFIRTERASLPIVHVAANALLT